MTRPFTDKRRLEWEIERRLLIRDVTPKQRRIEELDEMLAAFFEDRLNG